MADEERTGIVNAGVGSAVAAGLAGALAEHFRSWQPMKHATRLGTDGGGRRRLPKWTERL